MKNKTKKAWWKLLAGILFVVAAGIFYLCIPVQDAGQVQIFQEDKSSQKDKISKENTASGEKISFYEEISSGEKIFSSENISFGDASSEDISLEGQNAEGIYVHVCGFVKNPGVYCLAQNSRVVEAIEAAGGFLDGAAGDFLNQAELLLDGQKIYVPSELELEEMGETAFVPWQQSSQQGSQMEKTVNSKIDINTASLSQLMELDGIGKSKAEAIIAYRDKNGRFETCEDLMKVPGIKEAVYQKVCDKITAGR